MSAPAAPAAHGGAVAAAYVTVERTGQEVVESIDFVCDYLLMTVRGSLAGGSLPLEALSRWRFLPHVYYNARSQSTD